MWIKQTLTFFLLILAFPFLASSQTVSGSIIDRYNDAVVSAQLLNISSGKHTHSDAQGQFVMKNTQIGDTIKISHLSYEPKVWVVHSLNSVILNLKEKSIALEEIVIAPRIDALNLITAINVQTNPVNSSQDVLQQVPGLMIGQHAGGGKAEQIFLRGFDIDHGTDIAIAVDGLPVNMVSHAHGQGYADLHFIIPETIEKIDFGKGPYFADQGNFNTAGYVNFQTKQQLNKSSIKMELGQFQTRRLLGMFDILNTKKNQSYLAAEYLSSDGPFESPQNFNRINLFGKYTSKLSDTENIDLLFSHFTSQWDASGQVPQRAVDDGSISRFGAIDDTEGGQTSRTNVIATHKKFIDQYSFIKNSIYFTKYDFELFSNFTFFLEDPINGDQIRQKESRTIFGLNSEYQRSFALGNHYSDWQAGLSLRTDRSLDNELSHTLNRREILRPIQLGDINETNLGAYFNLNINLGKWVINPALRLDHFNFQYQDALATTSRTETAHKAILSPKLNILYNYVPTLQLYAKSGKGFHANDTRVSVEQSGNSVIPAAYGTDLGFIWKPIPNLFINTAYWFLFLEQEFVYVGDAGIVEPSGKTQRQGVDLSIRYQPIKWLFWNFDANYAYARTVEEESQEDFIPLAPDFTFVNSLHIIHESGIFGGLHIRYMDDRPANEDNSIVAKGYTVADVNIGYKMKRINIELQVQNLFDMEWNETQFATESRLQDEVSSVEEIHFTPGTPFFFKGVVEYTF